MLNTGILNPAINSLVSRVRHTNTLVIADRGFPFWPEIETVDTSLVDDIRRVLNVLRAVQRISRLGASFRRRNSANATHQKLCKCCSIFWEMCQPPEPHADFKKRVPRAI